MSLECRVLPFLLLSSYGLRSLPVKKPIANAVKREPNTNSVNEDIRNNLLLDMTDLLLLLGKGTTHHINIEPLSSTFRLSSLLHLTLSHREDSFAKSDWIV
jgi:hypothetical protein